MFKYTLLLPTFILAIGSGGWEFNRVNAAERPTLQHNTRDPRPDILPHPLYDSHVEYRRVYNRPSYIGGWIADKLSRTSQESMAWRENLLAGNYDQKHMPPMYKRYYAPKPWEVLPTGPRPDYAAKTQAKLARPTASTTTRQNAVSESAPIELSNEDDSNSQP